jgi:hypothetical protein
MRRKFFKDPDANLDYTIIWTQWLKDDAITSSDWEITPTGLTKTQESYTATRATIWLAEGDPGVLYTVKNHITTAAGRIEDRSVEVLIGER